MPKINITPMTLLAWGLALAAAVVATQTEKQSVNAAVAEAIEERFGKKPEQPQS